ncbi:substrate-binding domain-containing protein [Azotobacter salinestris]|uniref:substrate-binding domain-containing protein n=1 Tax=Azotobacter salinestris TaxID=69964 RepID=UPI0032DFEE1A
MKDLLFFCQLLSTAFLFCGLPITPLAHAEALQFALVAKQVDHPFFIHVGEGCTEVAKTQGDTCLLLGASGPAHFRRQNKVLEEAINRGDLHGIALSVTHSQWLANHALKRVGQIPLITFDSDLEPAQQHLRHGYVGLDNVAFGRQLGLLAQRFRPQGGMLCILSGSPQDTNLQERLQGIRQQLSGIQDKNMAAHRLQGEKGWNEPNRCPLYAAGSQETALAQLATLLHSIQVDVVIGNSWTIYQADFFRRKISPLLAKNERRGTRPVLILTADEPDEAQLALLEDGQVQAYLGAEGREIGRQSYWMLKRLVQGNPIPERTLVRPRIYLPKALKDTPKKP